MLKPTQGKTFNKQGEEKNMKNLMVIILIAGIISIGLIIGKNAAEQQIKIATTKQAKLELIK